MSRHATLLALILVLTGCKGLPPGYPYKIDLHYGVDDPQFARTMQDLFGPPLDAGNTIITLNNGDEIFPAMLDAIRAAEKSITFETYVYYEGSIGDEFTNALEERAKAGVQVHLLIDALGSDRINKDYLRRLRDAGADVVIFNPLKWWDMPANARLNNRTHRKILVIDGTIGFTGGVGIGDEWLGRAQDRNHWREMHYMVTGPVISQLQAAFVDHWLETRGIILHGDDYFPPLSADGKAFAQVYKSSAKGGGSESMQLMYLISLAAARKHIRLGTAYFVPDELTIAALMEARKRGVRVQILVPNELTDTPITRQASRAMWGDLLTAGVEIYEYQPTMYHCKLMVVDDRWTSIGSANFDNRSFRLNSEANLNVLDIPFAAEQAKWFDEDLKHSKRITYEAWSNRPVTQKLREFSASLLKWQL